MHALLLRTWSAYSGIVDATTTIQIYVLFSPHPPCMKLRVYTTACTYNRPVPFCIIIQCVITVMKMAIGCGKRKLAIVMNKIGNINAAEIDCYTNCVLYKALIPKSMAAFTTVLSFAYFSFLIVMWSSYTSVEAGGSCKEKSCLSGDCNVIMIIFTVLYWESRYCILRTIPVIYGVRMLMAGLSE